MSIVEANIAPKVTIYAKQNGKVVSPIYQDKGMLTISADVVDVNLQDTHSYDWSLSDNRLSPPTAISQTEWQIDPAQLIDNEFYNIKLIVSDGLSSIEKESILVIKDQAPILSVNTDTDGDGISDATEGLGDSDADGVPDYLDVKTLPEELMAVLIDGNASVIETSPGLKIKLGSIGQKAGSVDGLVSTSDIANFGNAQSTDTGYSNVGGLFDFIISDLSNVGDSAAIVLPQITAIPANAVYRKYNDSNGWQNFTETVDGKNAIYSALGALGACPSPDSGDYTKGLIQGNYCVKLLIQDGSENDSDGVLNGEINDPGGVGVVGTPSSNAPTKKADVDIRTTEGNENHVNYFLLEVNEIFDHDVSVFYQTQTGTALEGQDYIATSGTATIKQGELSTVIPVEIIGDYIQENEEYFYLVISNPIGAYFPENVTEISTLRTIVDDDDDAGLFVLRKRF